MKTRCRVLSAGMAGQVGRSSLKRSSVSRRSWPSGSDCEHRSVSGDCRNSRLGVEPVVRWIDAKIECMKREREQRHLRKVEIASLRADGKNWAEAQAIADEVSNAMVRDAEHVRSSARQALDLNPAIQRARRKQLYTNASEAASRRSPLAMLQRVAVSLLAPFIGGRTRFLVGASLIAAFGYRLYSSGALAAEDGLGFAIELVFGATELDTIAIPIIPDWLLNRLSSLAGGAAGMALVTSSISSSFRAKLCGVAGAIVCLLGPTLGVPAIVVPAETISLAAGLGLALFGWILAPRLPLPFIPR